MPRWVDYLGKIGGAVIFMALVTELVMPNRNTARVIETMGQGFAIAVRTAMAHDAIVDRKVDLAWEYIYEMSSDEQLELLTELTDDDFEWLERMSTDV